MPYETSLAETTLPPQLEANMALWSERLDRLASEVPNIAGSNQYPEWYLQGDESLRDIEPQLKAETTDISNVSRYYELFTKESELRSVITGIAQMSQPIEQLAYRLGDDLLGRALRVEPEDGAIHRGMIDSINNAVEQPMGTLVPELNVLKAAYGLDSATELLGISGSDYSDELRGLLLSDQSVKWMRYLDEERSPDWEWRETQEAMRKWMSKGVEAATGMSASEAFDYVFTASRSGSNEDFISIVQKFDHFGVDRIRQLADSTGIHGLEAYSVEQLERMEEFGNNPAKVAERLAEHDSMIVMINRFGDHNGVLRNVAADFDDDNERSLFFEITSMDDIYKRMVTLRKAGVKPSTLVLAAHSAPGQFMVSDVREKDKSAHKRDIATVAGRKLVAMANINGEHDEGDFSYSMHGMKGMARLVETYMQPSRAIDDNKADVGREKIIFQACNAASETGVFDAGESREKAQTGMESVISQLGKDLIISGIKTDIDIYGAAGGIQLHRNERGVYYTGQPTSYEEGRPHLAAQRIRVEDGMLTKEEVEYIPLGN